MAHVRERNLLRRAQDYYCKLTDRLRLHPLALQEIPGEGVSARSLPTGANESYCGPIGGDGNVSRSALAASPQNLERALDLYATEL
jgi:hypothetical protein